MGKLRRWNWRIFWFSGLLLLWLLCSGVALAEPLTERLNQYPNWQGKPALQPAQGDLIYPDWFAGAWVVTTKLVDLVAPLAPDLVTPGFESNRQFLQQPIEFKVRFVAPSSGRPAGTVRAFLSRLLPQPNQQPGWIADRAYNGTQLAKAYLGNTVQVVKVDPQNPNRQITLLRGERQLVSTVTERASESPSPDRLLTSELFQQEFRGAAQIYFNAVENTTAYTHLTSPTPSQPDIIADQVTAIYLSPQDADYFKTLSRDHPLDDPHPVALYRYQMEFRRTAGTNHLDE